jgi:hypothetical protein
MEPYALVYARAAYAHALIAALDLPYVVVTNRADLAAVVAKQRPKLAYVDRELVAQIQSDVVGVPVVAVVDGGLDALVSTLTEFPWLSHVIGTGALSPATLARLHLRIAHGAEHPILGAAGVGRAALLAHSDRREARLERLREFFDAQRVPSRIVASLSDVAEELMTNALYDAPAEAGLAATVSRTVEVELPPERACEISYGVEGGGAFVRVRDPFGALTRERLLAVLERCNRSGIALDESRGGAGLGMWRVFSSSSTIVITVMPGRLTDVLVWIDAAKRRGAAKASHALHLFFPEQHVSDGVHGRFAADHDHDLIDESFTGLPS